MNNLKDLILFVLIGIMSLVVNGCAGLPLHNAMFKGNLDEAQQMIAKQKDIDKPNSLGYRPLHIATDKRQNELFKSLVAQGVTIDPKANNGWTPLMFAVQHGEIAM